MHVKSFTYFSSAKVSSLRNLNGLPWPARPILARISMTQYVFGFTGSSAIQSPQMAVYATFTPLYLFEKKIFLLEKMVSTQGQETRYNLWCLCLSVVICCNKVLFFHLQVMSDSFRPHGMQQASPPLSPRVCSVHVHWVWEAIQPSHPLLSLLLCLQCFPAPGPLQWVGLLLKNWMEIWLKCKYTNCMITALVFLMIWPKSINIIISSFFSFFPLASTFSFSFLDRKHSLLQKSAM